MEVATVGMVVCVGTALFAGTHLCAMWEIFVREIEFEGDNLIGDREVDLDNEEWPPRRKLSPDEVANLPEFGYKEEGGDTHVPMCAVCLEKYKVGENCRLLPRCNHRFHAQCIDPWLIKTPICPICRSSCISH